MILFKSLWFQPEFNLYSNKLRQTIGYCIIASIKGHTKV